MSCYLNFYLIPKEGDKKVLIYETSRNSELYSAFSEVTNPPFYGGDEEPMKMLNQSILDDVEKHIQESIDNIKKYKEKEARISKEVDEFLAKVAAKLPRESLTELLEYKTKDMWDSDSDQDEYLGDLEYAKSTCYFLGNVLSNIEFYNKELYIGIGFNCG